jgi:hypothetical protein
MSRFGDDLIRAMGEALAHAKGEGHAILHARDEEGKASLPRSGTTCHLAGKKEAAKSL